MKDKIKYQENVANKKKLKLLLTAIIEKDQVAKWLRLSTNIRQMVPTSTENVRFWLILGSIFGGFGVPGA